MCFSVQLCWFKIYRLRWKQCILMVQRRLHKWYHLLLYACIWNHNSGKWGLEWLMILAGCMEIAPDIRCNAANVALPKLKWSADVNILTSSDLEALISALGQHKYTCGPCTANCSVRVHPGAISSQISGIKRIAEDGYIREMLLAQISPFLLARYLLF